MIDGLYKDGGFNGQLALDDDNGTVRVNGAFNVAKPIPDFNLKAIVKNLRPYELNLSENYQDSDISLNVTADFTGNSIDNINGRIKVDSLILNAPDNQGYFMDNLSITSLKKDKENELKIESSFMSALVKGDFSYQTLPTSVLHIMQQYIPSLISLKDFHQKSANNFQFDMRMENAEFFEKVLLLPIRMDMPSTLKGFINEKDALFRVEGSFPRLMYNGT